MYQLSIARQTLVQCGKKKLAILSIMKAVWISTKLRWTLGAAVKMLLISASHSSIPGFKFLPCFHSSFLSTHTLLEVEFDASSIENSVTYKGSLDGVWTPGFDPAQPQPFAQTIRR